MLDKIIIGIDPALINCGWGVIKVGNRAVEFLACGVIQPNPKLSLNSRLIALHCELKVLLETYNPQYFAIEETYTNQNARTSLHLAMTRGALIVAANNLEIAEYSPKTIKKTIAGHGSATKEDVERMLKHQIAIAQPLTSDETDAIAIAYTHALTLRLL